MKRYTTLIILLFSFLILQTNNLIKAQALNNTVWDFYSSTNNTYTATATFANDTFYFGNGPSSQAVAIIGDSANIMSIQDIDTSSCGTSIGRYLYTISSGTNDTITFSPLGDACTARQSFFTSVYGLRTMVGIDESISENSLKIYPNPSLGPFQIEANLALIGARARVLDLSGKEINNFRINSERQSIEINAESGIYFLSIEHKGKKVVKKLIIQ